MGRQGGGAAGRRGSGAAGRKERRGGGREGGGAGAAARRAAHLLNLEERMLKGGVQVGAHHAEDPHVPVQARPARGGGAAAQAERCVLAGSAGSRAAQSRRRRSKAARACSARKRVWGQHPHRSARRPSSRSVSAAEAAEQDVGSDIWDAGSWDMISEIWDMRSGMWDVGSGICAHASHPGRTRSVHKLLRCSAAPCGRGPPASRQGPAAGLSA